MKKHLFVLLMSIYSCGSFAQKTSYKMYRYIDGFSLTLKAGSHVLLGELGTWEQPSLYGLLAIEKGISPIFHFKTQFQLGNLLGMNAFPYQAYAQTTYFQWSNMAVINVYQLIKRDNKPEFNLYLSAGLGFLRFHTDVYDLSSGAFLRTTADASSKHTPLFQPYGIGIGNAGIYYTREWSVPVEVTGDWKLLPQVYLNVTFTYNWVTSDKLDGTTPYNLIDRTTTSGQYSYSDTPNDGWIGLSIGIRYKFASLKRMLQRGI